MIISGELEKVPLLDVLQVLAHSSQSGVLSVEAESASGSIVFEAGGIICVASSSTEALLKKAMRERDAQNGRAFRRIQALAGLAELLALRAGVFRFTRVEDHVTELANVALEPFYAAGAMEAGDLLLVLATMVDRAPTSPSPAAASEGSERAHPRYAPTVIAAELLVGASRLTGHLTNLSAGGSFFHGESLPAVDSAWSLCFELPGAAGAVEVGVRVAWTRPDLSEGVKGVGLTFERISEEHKALVTKYLSRFQALADKYRLEPSIP